MKKLVLFATMAISLLAVSCSEAPTDSEVLIEGQWRLKSLSSVDQVNMPEHDSYTLSFDTVQNRLFGRGNCNLYFADYKLGDSNLIVVNRPGATMMMCHDDNAEKEFFDMIEQINAYKMEKGNVKFLSKDGVLLSVFVPYTPQEQPEQGK